MTKRCPSIRKIWDYANRRLHLETFLRDPGDGRTRPQIAATNLVWAQIAGQILQVTSFHGIERLVRSGAARALRLGETFSEDSLAYFNERLQPQPARDALAATARLAKRNKVFRGQARIGLALDGTGAGRCSATHKLCTLCRPYADADGKVVGHKHEVVMMGIVGVDLTMPVDVEPFGQGDSEMSASRRLLPRAVQALGPRFADYVVGDAKYAAAPLLNDVAQLGLHAVVRLKENLPDLHGRATVRFNSRPPDETIDHHGVAVEIWDDDGFQPWEGLEWSFVRVIRYRYRSQRGELVDAYWLTSYPKRSISSGALFRLAKSRWEIENQCFNEAKTRHGMEHISRHNSNALIVGWLLLMLALVIERLYRLCHLHRGNHPRTTAADLLTLLRLALGRPPIHDSS